jgi:hypothetical protein
MLRFSYYFPFYSQLWPALLERLGGRAQASHQSKHLIIQNEVASAVYARDAEGVGLNPDTDKHFSVIAGSSTSQTSPRRWSYGPRLY